MYALGFWIFIVGYLGCQVSSTRHLTLANKNLKMGVVPFAPYLFKNKKGTYSGILWDFLDYMQKARNCTFTVVVPPDGLFGSCYGNNSCTGMLGLVNRSEVDFATGKGVCS